MKAHGLPSPNLLDQPQTIIENVQSYLGPRSATRLEAVHPRFTKVTAANNRYWKDAFIRETEKNNHVRFWHQNNWAGAPTADLAVIKKEHPYLKPKGYWKNLYRDIVHPARKTLHVDSVRHARLQKQRMDLEIPELITAIAIAPPLMLCIGGYIAAVCSAVVGSVAIVCSTANMGTSRPVAIPLIKRSMFVFAGGIASFVGGLATICLMFIPCTALISGARRLSEWNFERQRRNQDDRFVEES